MKLTDIRDALLTIGVPVYHYEAQQESDKYIVWSEDGQGSQLKSDDMAIGQSVTGTVDYYTRMEYDPNTGQIQTALNDLFIPWELSSVQYETDTKFIHYEWRFEIEVWHA